MEVFLNPLIFFGLLGLLFVVSIAVSFLALNKENQRKKIESLFEEVNSSKQVLEQKIHEFNNEINTLKKELGLKSQMYDGLRSQYAELEKDFEKLNQPKASQSKPQDPSSQDSIINLLKSLNKS